MQSRDRNYNISSNHVLAKMIIFFISFSIIILIESKPNDGFSTDLIHIHSPLSPFYNLKETHQDLLNHTEHVGSSKLIFDRNLYLMKISYGTPAIKYYHVIDTGSELSWINCLPCVHCFASKYAPFDPEKSKTFHFEECSAHKRCLYNETYGDGAHYRGEYARETIIVGSGSHKIKFENFLFGCGHDNVGRFPHSSAGLAGLNPEKNSFITQLQTKHHGKFSYCMAPSGSSSPGKISFGHEAIVSSNNVMTTPLILDSFYNIMLDAITVGNKKLKYFPDSNLSSNGSNKMNVQLKLTIDSGSNVIYLSNSFYSEVETSVKKHIKAMSPIGERSGYRLCYSSSLRDIDIPKIKLHFPGVVLELSPINTFRSTNTVRCLAFIPGNKSILGNMAQVNCLVAFDLVEKKVSFKPTNCARL